MKPIAVLGSGAVGKTLAADCKLAGAEVRLHGNAVALWYGHRGRRLSSRIGPHPVHVFALWPVPDCRSVKALGGIAARS